MKTGKIRIKDDGVYFEPDGLEKPIKPDFTYDRHRTEIKLAYAFFDLALREYEASKQLVEVSGVDYRLFEDGEKLPYIHNMAELTYLKDNQKCEAEVTDKAIIIKIL